MPGDTKIKRTPNGWIDVDEPTKSYPVRWQARNARRFRLRGITPISGAALVPLKAVDTQVSLTSLQKRLFDRMTDRQGVSVDDALDVIKNNGYNKAASYGHMRAAGANHSEALIVISLEMPAVSVAYGQHRAIGYNHTDALRDALVIGDMDDDD